MRQGDKRLKISFWHLLMNFEKPKKSDSFAPLLTPKIKFGKNVKKTHEDIILLHMHTINQDHMIMVPEI